MQTNQALSIPGTNVRLGDRARDVVTGFEGIVTSYSRHLTGCHTLWLTGKHTTEGKTQGQWVDIQRVGLVEANPLNVKPVAAHAPSAG